MKRLTQITVVLMICVLMVSCSAPKAVFNYSGPVKPAPIAKVTFENSSKKAITYLWEFGDGATSTEASPSHTFRTSGNYEVTLKATNGEKESVTKKTIQVNAPKNCTILLETDMGTMTILLYDETPYHRDNFIKLAEEGFYDDLIFHRVINGFMIQGGDPDSRESGTRLGSGGPGYTVEAEIVEGLHHVKGALAAARRPDQVNPEKRSSGSQFYIVQGNQWDETQLQRIESSRGFKYSEDAKSLYEEQGGTAHLDGEYTVFGKVIDGLDVIDKIAATETDGDPPRGSSRPIKDIKMKVRVVY